MSVAIASPAESSPKRAAILSAGARLFMGVGYASVSMDAVAKEAGVSKATVYAHFSSKEALFGAIVGDRCSAIAAQAEELASQAPSAQGALRELGRLWMRFLLHPDSMAIHRTVIAECTRFPDLARAFYEAGPARGRIWLAHRMQEELRQGRLRADADPGIAADHLMGMLRGELYIRAVLGGPAPDDAAIDATVDQAVAAFLRAYGAAPESSGP
ncbi:TetR/AcrR family transcriptional regulator [Roseomonas sp. SSH11]|uniref:TetR/AcrR family transcriptional regulator n=1 Tax=Pararoseomonas baculiformis TaxID=2820812 RepID=A0ABS4AIQ8_9PROT|nr:TetR/AcrR family transcriptional regulator [Pararoseomonas baculiformis]MBP0446756.1 TetR/AcrR family transcriptional regulator [Pararoseomonas baculiformis]